MAIGASIIAIAAQAAVAAEIIAVTTGLYIALGATLISYAFAPKPKIPALPNFSQEARDRTRQIRQPVTPWDIVYGEARKSGPLTFIETTDNAKQLHMVITLAGHPCEAWKAIYINDTPIYPSQLDGDGVVTTGKYANKAKFQVDLGTTGQPFADLVTDTTNWTADHKQAGRTKMYVRLTYDQDIYPTGIPNISVRLKGKTALDPRTSTTYWTPNAILCTRDFLATDTDEGGVGVATADIDSTTAISGANICDEFVATKQWTHTVDAVNTTDNYLDFTDTVTDPDANDVDDGLLHFWTGDRVEVASTGAVPGGLATSTSYYVIVVHERKNTVLKTRIQLAASYDDALSETAISLTSAGSGTITVYKTGEPRYTVNGIVSTDKQPHEHIRDMSTAMAGFVVNVGGQWQFTPGAWRSSSATFDEDTVRGGITWKSKRSRRERFNAIQGTYVSPHQYDQPTDYPPITSSTYQNEDDGKRTFQQVDMNFVNRASTCQRIGRIILNRHRRQITANFPLMLHGLSVKAADVVSINNTRAGWSGKTFEVTSWELQTEDRDGVPLIGIDLGLDEIDANVFAWDPNTDEVVPDAAETTILQDASTVAPPSGLTVTSGTSDLYIKKDGTVVSRINVNWTASPDAFLDRYELQYKRSIDSTYLPAIQSDDTQQYIWDVEDDVDYDIRVRAVSRLGVRSAYITELNHTVVGKTEPPQDVTGFTAAQSGNVVTFKWNQVGDVDLSGYEIRYFAQGGFAWDTATILTSVTKGTLITNAALPPGTWTVGVKAIDTSQNYSTNTTTYNISVSNVNTIIDEEELQDSFVGATLTNFVKHWTGKLLPSSTKAPNELTRAELFEQFVPYPEADCYVELPELDSGFDSDDLRLWSEVDSQLGPGKTGVADPQFQAAVKVDGGSYGAFFNHTIGVIPEARYVKPRFYLDTSQGVAYITRVRAVLDEEVDIKSDQDVAVSITGATITFDRQFHTVPNVDPTAKNAASIAVPSNITETGFDVDVYDITTGNQVAGTIDWEARGV